MPFLYSLKQLVNQNQLLQSLFNISKMIINVIPFYLVREGLSNENELTVFPKINPCKAIFLSPIDMKVISSNPEVPETKDILLERLSSGCLCLGIKYHDEIVAYMWCNLRKCDSHHITFKLREDEAYLMDARTFSTYRGNNLAPYLRVEIYRHLRQMGRTKFFSITEYFNESALRFKMKLSSKPVNLYLCIKLFRKLKWLVPLRRYSF